MGALNQLLSSLRIEANIFHNGQYCGLWAVDTSGSGFMTFHVVVKGRCSISIDDTVYELDSGDAVFMPTDATHRISSSVNDSAVKNEAVSFHMSSCLTEEATGLVCGRFLHDHPVFNHLVKNLPRVIIVRHKENQAIDNILNLMLDESVKSGVKGGFLLNRLADCVFYLLVRDNLSMHSGAFAATSHPKLSIAMNEIHSHADQRINVERLAQKTAMSRSAFTALFKQIVGQTPLEYAVQWKMMQAYRWLADEEISTYDAALRCGYESESSFSKVFKKVIGCGPGTVRK